ncbi:MAG: hypothetical protein WCT03_04970 [Candidatus Obscuribacterales bacterium]
MASADSNFRLCCGDIKQGLEGYMKLMSLTMLHLAVLLLGLPLSCEADTDFKTILNTPKLLPKERFGYNTMIDGNFCTSKVIQDPLSTKPAITNGPAYLLPKILTIHRFDLNGNPCVGADAGRLQIDVKGNAKLYILNSKVASMKSLDKNLTREILGIPTGPQGEDDNKPYYWTFDVMTIDPVEQNIYHIDVQFADADQHWKEYRVRGYRIGNPQWQVVE